MDLKIIFWPNIARGIKVLYNLNHILTEIILKVASCPPCGITLATVLETYISSNFGFKNSDTNLLDNNFAYKSSDSNLLDNGVEVKITSFFQRYFWRHVPNYLSSISQFHQPTWFCKFEEISTTLLPAYEYRYLCGSSRGRNISHRLWQEIRWG